MSSISIDIELDEIVSSLTRYDRVRLFEILQDDGYINKVLTITKEGKIDLPSSKSKNFSNNDFNKSLQILFNQGWRLSLEEEEIINKIAAKYEI